MPAGQQLEFDVRAGDRGLEALLAHVAEPGTHVLVFGEPGSGKTYLLLQLFELALGQQSVLPLYLPAGAFPAMNEATFDLADVVSRYYSHWLDTRELACIVSELESSKRYARLLLLDGLDEVEEDQRNGLLKALRDWVSNDGSSEWSILATCRDAAMWATDLRALHGFRREPIRVQGVQETLMSFAARQGKRELLSRLTYLGDIESPLVGSLVLYLMMADALPVSWNLASVYHNAVRQLILHQHRRARMVKGISSHLETLVNGLACVFGIMFQQRRDLTEANLMEIASRVLLEMGPCCDSAEEIRSWILERSVFKRNKHRLEVLHATIQEYLVALYYYDRICSSEDVDLGHIFSRDITIRHSHFLTDLLLPDEKSQAASSSKAALTRIMQANLRAIYEANRGSNALEQVVSRQQAAFYGGLVGCRDLDTKCRADLSVVRRGFIVGSAIAGRLPSQFRQYCVSLLTDAEEESVNLSYTLVHQGDHSPRRTTEYYALPLTEVNCRNAFLGMLRQLLKREYQNIDLLAVVTLSGYLNHCGAQVAEVIQEHRAWLREVSNELAHKLNLLERSEVGQQFSPALKTCRDFWRQVA